MKHFLLGCSIGLLSLSGLAGCGGHKGGVLEVAPEDNPYQASDQELEKLNSGGASGKK
ncbi:hypothetical protein [Roseiconus lacunae]|uniref:Lipoprotein n=1 Tax=Roseiconus lacunae TaxID=2605694 RepID=A0ABT7PLG9_9BACT|nr:hypothetical protein [Roseiconus lacunae]MCD0460890.1 hypothetical protein [Roseiconus lacunae]MDM4017354.1 hypothetical protein [Roseiconus lacunae]WRQ48735.1 hypothetical protein U8335_17400 [Stieleria sp. HD01]